MKNFKLLFCLLIFTLTIKSQSFYKKAVVVDAQAGIDIYDTKTTQHYTLSNLDTTLHHDDKAANKNFSFGLEYGIGKRVGVGARVKLNTYFTDTDSISNVKANVKSTDAMGFINYHLINKNHFNFLVGGSLGFTSLNWQTNNSKGDRIYSSGPYFDFHTTAQIYIKRFGFQASFYLPYAIYSKLKSNNPDFTKDNTVNLKFFGYGISGGICYRFGKSSD